MISVYLHNNGTTLWLRRIQRPYPSSISRSQVVLLAITTPVRTEIAQNWRSINCLKHHEFRNTFPTIFERLNIHNFTHDVLLLMEIVGKSQVASHFYESSGVITTHVSTNFDVGLTARAIRRFITKYFHMLTGIALHVHFVKQNSYLIISHSVYSLESLISVNRMKSIVLEGLRKSM